MAEHKFDAWKESKELYGLLKLQQIAESQTQQAAAMQQQATAIARGNEALAAVESAKLAVMQEQANREAREQEIRKELFTYRQALKTLETKEQDDPIGAFLWLSGLRQMVAGLPVRQNGGVAEMADQGNLLSEVDAVLNRVHERIPGEVAALSRLATHQQQLVSSARSLDKKWKTDYARPLRSLRKSQTEEMNALTAETQKKQQAASKSNISVVLAVIMMCFGGLGLLGSLATIPTIGKVPKQTEDGRTMTVAEETAGVVTGGVMSVGLGVGGFFWWRVAKRRRHEKSQDAQAAAVTASQRGAAIQATIDQLKAAEKSLPGEPLQSYLSARLHMTLGDSTDAPDATSETGEEFLRLLRLMQAELQQTPDVVPHAFNFGQALVAADLAEVEALVKLLGRLNVHCDSCKLVVAVRPEHRGRKVQCPKCQRPISIASVAIPDQGTLREISRISGSKGST